MVQDIADDIAKEQKDAKMAEEDAADVKAKLGVNINTLKETLQQKNDELAAINKQLDSLHKQCDELLKFFDKRKKGRAFEISQLRDVMDILSGSSIAARVGLVQQQDGAGADAEGQADAAGDTDA